MILINNVQVNIHQVNVDRLLKNYPEVIKVQDHYQLYVDLIVTRILLSNTSSYSSKQNEVDNIKRSIVL